MLTNIQSVLFFLIMTKYSCHNTKSTFCIVKVGKSVYENDCRKMILQEEKKKKSRSSNFNIAHVDNFF